MPDSVGTGGLASKGQRTDHQALLQRTYTKTGPSPEATA